MEAMMKSLGTGRGIRRSTSKRFRTGRESWMRNCVRSSQAVMLDRVKDLRELSKTTSSVVQKVQEIYANAKKDNTARHTADNWSVCRLSQSSGQ